MPLRDHTPRYLVPFHPKQVPHFFADVLIIGGGLGGLRTALSVRPDLSVLVVTKDKITISGSTMAQGGIAGILSPDDRQEDHVDDTLTAGGSLCEQEVVELVVRESSERIGELIAWGTAFDRAGLRLSLTREGGHGRNRIAHALGDATGREIMRAVSNRVLQTPHVKAWEDTFTLDLLTHQGTCRGALVWNPRHGKTLVWAKQTVLSTGGAGQ
ncbi:MAG: FAD-binding protein, partial [Pirellulaceae bacterium]|nr:FAD-binding protein [Pirellulaceae bacterium]